MKYCACCGSELRPLDIRDNFLNNPLQQCTFCGHIQLAQIPDEAALLRYYETTYSTQRSKKNWIVYHKTMQKRAAAQMNYINLFFNINTQSTVLDYGCGYGYLLQALKQHTPHAAGVDYDDRCIESCQEKGLTVSKIRSEQELADLPKVDLLTASHVVEHLTDLEGFINLIKQKSDHAFIEVPCYDLVHDRQWVDQMGHIHFFNEKSLRLLLDKHNCEILDLHRCGPSMWMQWYRPAEYVQNKIRMLPFFNRMDYFWGYYSNQNPEGIWLRAFVKTSVG